MILGVEFVADQATKRPFPPSAGVTRKIVEAALAAGVMVVPGMGGMIDGVAGDHIQISPPYIFNEANVEQLVDGARDGDSEGHARGSRSLGAVTKFCDNGLAKEEKAMTAQSDARFAGEDYLRHIMLDYRQMTEFVKEPFLVARADGIRFWDVYGKEYLDGLAGIFTVNVGYNNPRVLQAVIDQLRTLPFNPPMHGTNPRAVELANLLAEITPGDLNTARLVDSGSEANEAAFKLVRQYHRQTGNPGKFKILSRYLSYHGATRRHHERRGGRLPEDDVRARGDRASSHLPPVLLSVPLREDLSGLRRLLRPDPPADDRVGGPALDRRHHRRADQQHRRDHHAAAGVPADPPAALR